ncbi:MAG: SGNH/GDSL hydrolase family protein [Rhodospirillales bacterium]
MPAEPRPIGGSGAGGRFTGVFASAVIVAAAGVFVALFVLNVTNWASYAGTLSGLLYHFVLPLAAAGGILALLRLGPQGRLAAALSLGAVVPALYLTELTLGLRARSAPAGAATAFDGRGKLDVIMDRRRRGIEAYPAMRARAMLVEGPGGGLVSALGGDGLLPLASLPGAGIVSCNESGRWMVFDSDRHGFHNPVGVWDAGPPALALVGDSFTQGDCVPSDKNIAAHLRRRFGGVLNLGVSGHGPLAELAAVKEYLAAVRPPVVAWLYFEGNDLFKDLPEERRSPVLMSYLTGGFTQNLMARRDELRKRFKAYLDARLVDAMGRVDHPYLATLDFLKLFHLRETFGLDPVALGVARRVTEDNLRLLKGILQEARRTVASWGGRFVFVFMPDTPRYFAAPRDSRIRDRVRGRVLDLAQGLGLPVIDVHGAIAAHPDPQALFVYPGSHFNEAGYKAAAEAIAKGLEKVGAKHP